MTSRNIARLTFAFVTLAHDVYAQPPVRTVDVSRNDPARTVTLSLPEYNRLLDLAGRPPQGPAVAPMGEESFGIAGRAEVEPLDGVDARLTQGVFADGP